MPAASGQEAGVSKSFVLRAGITHRGLTGINRRQHPGAVRDTDSYAAENVRIVGGRYDNRWGQSRLSESTVQGCVYGITDSPQAQQGPPAALWFVRTTGTYVASNGDGVTLSGSYVYSPEFTPQFQRINQNVEFVLNGKAMFCGKPDTLHSGTTGTSLYDSQVTLPPSGLEMRALSIPGAREIALDTSKPQTSSLPAIVRSEVTGYNTDGTPIISDVAYEWQQTTPSTACRVTRYDGHALTQEVVTTDASISLNARGFGFFRENLYITGYDAGGRMLLLRRDSAGVYTQITGLALGNPAAGTGVNQLDVFKALAYKDKLYMAGVSVGSQGAIVSYDGAAFALARYPVTGDTGVMVEGLGLFNGYLYYSWIGLGGGTNTTLTYNLGRFDGTTWLDSHCMNLQALLSTSTGGSNHIFSPVAYRGKLYVSLRNLALNSGILVSNGTATSSMSVFKDTGALYTDAGVFHPVIF